MEAEWSSETVSLLRTPFIPILKRLIRPKDLNEIVIVATSEEFTDFAYISLAKEQLAWEMPAHDRQYHNQRLNTLNSDVEIRDYNNHDIAGGSAIPETVVRNYSNSFRQNCC